MKNTVSPARIARGIATGIIAVVAVVTVMPAGASSAQPSVAPAAAADSVAKLREQVADMANHEATLTGPQLPWVDTRVEVSRTQGGRWAFGTVALVAPAMEGAQPRDWLFVAEQRRGHWLIGLDGQAAFAEIAARSPVVTAPEKVAFASLGEPSTQAAGDFRTGMRLPWAIGQSWVLRGGPHAWDAGSGPWSSVDLYGGDERVLAPRAGLAYTTCTGRIIIVHDRGYTTRYYHLINHIWVDGASVAAGAFLGYTGTETGCGGSASSRHVHFSLLQNDTYVAIAHHIIGKWVLMNGTSQYGGYALHGSRVANVGGLMYNYGPLGFTEGIVDADGGSTVNRRSGPGTGYAVVGSAADGSTISIACSANGTTHTGRWGTTSLWNRLTDGTWISDAFVYTGIDGPVNGWC